MRKTLNLQIPTAPVFKPLLAPARYKGAFGGRGSGKSWFFAGEAIEKCITHPGTRIVCIREVQRSLKESVKLLLEDMIEAFKVGHYFRVLHDRIEGRGNSLIVFQGMQDHTAESVKSLAGFNVAYAEEAQTLTSRSLELLRPTIREPGSELWFSWNPRNAGDPVDKLLRGESPPENSIIIRVGYKDNPWFPPELEEERRFDLEHNPARYSHIWDGEYEPRAIGAIWDREVIHRNRRAEAPPLARTLVCIDPPKKSEEGSDRAGIVVTALGQDGRGYVLHDASKVASPEEWAKTAIGLYDLYEADAIVAEINNGGEMVKQTIHSIRKSVRVIEVTATRGKHVRAEPISALYSIDQISHVGSFPELERQMCFMTPSGYEGEDSPDALDAMVWGITELFPRMTRKVNSGKDRPVRQNNRYNPLRLHQLNK